MILRLLLFLALLTASAHTPAFERPRTLDEIQAETESENLFSLNANISRLERESRNVRLARALAEPYEEYSVGNVSYRDALNRTGAEALLERLISHPVAGPSATRDRDAATGGAIGFCFGRAFFVEREALSAFAMDPLSVRKLWAIGTLDSPSRKITWGHHVATLVKAKTRGWWVIDSFLGLHPAPEWMERVRTRLNQRRGDVGFYLTRSDRFSPTRDRAITASEIEDKKGFYKGFFKDLLAYEAKHPSRRYTAGK